MLPKTRSRNPNRGRQTNGKYQNCTQILLSCCANSSLRSLYSFSFSHFFVRKSSIDARPRRKALRLRQMEVGVYAWATLAGSLVFQRAWAAFTFW